MKPFNHTDLWRFIGAVVLILFTLFLPADSLTLRIIWAIGGVVLWVCLFYGVREWFVKRRARKIKKQESNHVA